MQFKIKEDEKLRIEHRFRNMLIGAIPNILGVITINSSSWSNRGTTAKYLSTWQGIPYKQYGFAVQRKLDDSPKKEDYSVGVDKDFYQVEIKLGNGDDELYVPDGGGFPSKYESFIFNVFREYDDTKYYYLIERKPFEFEISDFGIKGDKYSNDSGGIIIHEESFIRTKITGRYALVEAKYVESNTYNK